MQKRLLAVILALALCLGLMPVSAFADQYTDAGWDISDGLLYGYYGSETDLVIPDTVTSINEGAFKSHRGITSVTIPESITSIPDETFWSCPDLTSVTIPSTVTSIGARAFYNCPSLTTVNIPNGVSVIKSATFADCSSLTSITLPGSLSEIDTNAFAGSGLTSITIPEGVTVIGEQAFENCDSLTSVSLPGTLTQIERSAFYNCSRLTGITLPDSLSSIGDSAFMHCSSLTSVSIPSAIKQIEYWTFYGCSGLTSITIPEGVTTIGMSAFYNCFENLLNLVLPSSITSVVSGAFGGGMSKLVNVYYTGSRWDTISKGSWPLQNATRRTISPCASSHTYDEGTVTKEPTCSAEGVKTFSCTVCGWVEQQTIEKTAHTPGGAATSNHNGTHSLHCSVCNKDIEEPCAYGTWTVTTAATCTAEGVRTAACTACGHTKTEAIPMTGHAYGNWTETTAATCTADGEERRVCSHDSTHVETRVVPATGHDWGEWRDNGDGTHSQICNHDSSHTQKSGEHTYSDWTVTTPATCTADGIKTAACTACGHTKTEAIAKIAHIPGNAVSNDDGTHSIQCTVCQQEISSEACTYGDWTVTTAATCTADGIKTAACTACGHTKTESIAMTGHDYGEWTVTTPATCTANGEERRVCSNDNTHVETRVIPATGHDWGEWRDNGDGTHSQICRHDPSHTQENGEHTYGEWTVTKEPTAGEAGLKERSCDKCGHKETEELPATGGPSVNPNPGGGGSSGKPNPGGNTSVKPEPDKDKPTPGDPTPDKPVFTDVPETAFYANPVNWAVEKGITRGTSDATFSPNQPCTRKEIVTFLWRAAGSPEPETAANPFTDVEGDTYYAKAVLWALENGITSGTTATTFAPDVFCTRWQVVTFLWRAKDKPAASTAGQFSDVESNAAYAQAVAWAVEAGVTNGTSTTTFAPNDICSRGQIVTFLYRACK